MFLDEARLVALLNHHNIASVFEVDVVDGKHYLAMEYVHGADLRPPVVILAERDPGLDLAVEALLLGDDLRRRAALCDFIAHAWNGRI